MTEPFKPEMRSGECEVSGVLAYTIPVRATDESQEAERLIALYRERRYGSAAVESEERDMRIHGLEFFPPESLWVPPDERRKS